MLKVLPAPGAADDRQRMKVDLVQLVCQPLIKKSELFHRLSILPASSDQSVLFIHASCDYTENAPFEQQDERKKAGIPLLCSRAPRRESQESQMQHPDEFRDTACCTSRKRRKCLPERIS